MLLLIMKNIFPERQSGQALPRDPKIAENSKREAEAARRMIYRLINRNVPGYASNLVLHRRYQITKKKARLSSEHANVAVAANAVRGTGNSIISGFKYAVRYGMRYLRKLYK